VARALDGLYRFDPLPAIQVKGEGAIAIWGLSPLERALAGSAAADSPA